MNGALPDLAPFCACAGFARTTPPTHTHTGLPLASSTTFPPSTKRHRVGGTSYAEHVSRKVCFTESAEAQSLKQASGYPPRRSSRAAPWDAFRHRRFRYAASLRLWNKGEPAKKQKERARVSGCSLQRGPKARTGPKACRPPPCLHMRRAPAPAAKQRGTVKGTSHTERMRDGDQADKETAQYEANKKERGWARCGAAVPCPSAACAAFCLAALLCGALDSASLTKPPISARTSWSDIACAQGGHHERLHRIRSRANGLRAYRAAARLYQQPAKVPSRPSKLPSKVSS